MKYSKSRSVSSLFGLVLWAFSSFIPVLASESEQVKPLPSGIHGYAHLKADVLALSAEVKAQLDQEIRPIRSQHARTTALHNWMFAPSRLGIRYNSEYTFTAQQTFDYRVGNCMSLAALFVAAARYVGLKATFQLVDVPVDWEPRTGYYVVPGHINVVIQTKRQRIYVEFLNTFFEGEVVTGRTKRVSDERAFAEYHNNSAMAYFAQNDMHLTLKHLQHAVSLSDASRNVWSNYGVVQKKLGRLDEAERGYRAALKLDKHHYSALTNLYILLSEQGRHGDIHRLNKKVRRYAMKNPFHLAKLADAQWRSGDAESALKHINNALDKRADVAIFYHIKANILLTLRQLDAASNAHRQAQKYSDSASDEARYERKWQALQGLASR